jgi:hypothetical protein
MPATGPQYSPSQLNYFKTKWDTKFPAQPWDDSDIVRNQLSVLEARTPKIPTGKSYMEWDCTALFAATIFARTFRDAAGRTLAEQYLTPVPPGTFRFTVTSANGIQDETFALAIDQLRLLRNEHSHSSNTEVLDKTTFHYCIYYAKKAFQAVNYSTNYIDDISKLPETEFPTGNVAELKKIIKEKRGDGMRFHCIVTLLLVIIALLLVMILFVVVGDGIRSFFKPSGPSGKAYNVHKKEIGLSLINALSTACTQRVN